MKSEYLLFIGAIVFVIVVRLLSRGAANMLDSAAERRKKEADRAGGAYSKTRPESLADRYKK